MMKKHEASGIALKNIITYSLFLALIACVLTVKAGEKLSLSFITPNPQVISDSFSTVIFVFITFIIYFFFLCIAGSIIAFNSRRYFSNVEVKKALLYLLSVIPPIIVSKYLINSYGPFSLAVITLYITLSFTVNYFLKKYIWVYLFPVVKTKPRFLFINIFIELLLFSGLLALITKIPAINNHLPHYNLDDLKSFLGWYARVLFIVVFNYINYISIEYISMTFMLEMKKPHVKYYFIYNSGIVSRFLYLLKTNLPVVLKKIKLYLAWFVSIIILFEMDNHIYHSVGNRIYYQGNGETLNAINIFSIFITVYGFLCIVNTIMELYIAQYGGNQSAGKNTVLNIKNESGSAGLKITIKNLTQKKAYIAIALFALCVTAGAVLYSGQYTILQHYDFYTAQKFTVGYLFDEDLRSMPFDKNMVNVYAEKPLCIKEKGVFFTRYSILEFVIEGTDETGALIKRAMPVLEVSSENLDTMYPELSFIFNGNRKVFSTENYLVEYADLKDITYTNQVVIPTVFTDKYIPFNLERNYKSNGSEQPPVSSNKLLFPILLYYMFYFFLAAVLLLLIVYLIYVVIINLLLSLRAINVNKLASKAGAFIFNGITLFITSTPFIIIIAFLYVFFPEGNKESGFSTFASILTFTNNWFINSVAVYCLGCSVIIFYSLPSAIDDIVNFSNSILNSPEIKYLVIAGFDKRALKKAVFLKYGKDKILQVFLECLLFLFVLQFFIMYCFSQSQFTDIIGIGSILSIENVVTKVYRTQIGFTPIIIFHYVILLLLYGVIYGASKILKKGRVS